MTDEFRAPDRLVIFLSAVSSEFHTADPAQVDAFRSYRDTLAEAFRRTGRPFHIIVQEELAQGFADLLYTLEQEVEKCHLVIHLVGRLSGAKPEEAPLRRLQERHPNLLPHEPELRRALGELSEISYTQWEIYFAFQHRSRRLIFVAEDNAPRSPACKPTEAQRISQDAHLARLKLTGEHREPFSNQLDLALKAITSVIRYGWTPAPLEPVVTPAAVSAARTDLEGMVSEIGEVIARPNQRIPADDSKSEVDTYLGAIDSAARKHNLNRQTVLALLDEFEAIKHTAATSTPTASNLLDLAFAKLALGKYQEAIELARQAANEAKKQMHATSPQLEGDLKAALNAFLLMHDAATASKQSQLAMAALEKGLSLIDKTSEPLLWADFSTALAIHLLKQYKLDEAESLVWEILAIHEENLAENDPQLADTLFVCCKLLHKRGKYPDAADFATRAAAIYLDQSPPEITQAAMAMSYQGRALYLLDKWAEAEAVFRRALEIDENCFGSDAGVLAEDLSDLALVLAATNRPKEAELLMVHAVGIAERQLGPQSTVLATLLNSLALVLRDLNRDSEGQALLHRALAIQQATFGERHPEIAATLQNLALSLQSSGRLGEAEALFRRSLSICEEVYGLNHPLIARNLSNLALVIEEKGDLQDAEVLLRRGLAVCESTLGTEHSEVATYLCNLVGLLLKSGNRMEEAEAVSLRALRILETKLGDEHPHVAIALKKLADVLSKTNRKPEADGYMTRALTILLRASLTMGGDHPNLQKASQAYHALLCQMALSESDAWKKINDIAFKFERRLGPSRS